jgi:anti-sigma B factor antagonist
MSEPETANPIDASVLSLGDDAAVVHVRGEVDGFTAEVMARAVDQAFTLGVRRLLIDLDGVTFFGTGGVGALIHTRQRALHDGVALMLVCSNRLVLRTVELAGLLNLFSVAGSTDAALS